jgi:homoserine kinase
VTAAAGEPSSHAGRLAPVTLRPCAVRIPCSTSNLGAGFDCLGLAFSRYLDAGFEPGDHPLTVQRRGTLEDLEIAPEDDIVLATFMAELARRGVSPVTGTLLLQSDIPVGRGLGSSGAAAVAGIALATAACGMTLDRDDALAMAVRAEGHPDNAAPSLFGGLVAVAYPQHGVPRAMRLPLSDAVAWVFAAPDATVSTQRARAVLPREVPHSAAVRNSGRMAALLYGLANADRDAVSAGFTDELHVPYRLPLIPGGREAMAAAVEAGAWACTISGSGSGIIAAVSHPAAAPVLAAMCESFQRRGHGGGGFLARPDAHGVQPRDIGTLRDAFRH